MLKLADNPPILKPEISSIEELEGTWWVAHTKAKAEKKFAWEMYNRGIGYFLPMQKKVIFSGGRKRKVLKPLFTSYVFFCGSNEDRYAAMTTNKLCQTIEVKNREKFVSELNGLEKALFSKKPLELYPNLPKGTPCVITQGPLSGTEGVVVQKHAGKARIVLEVTILGQGGLVEVDADLLESLD